MLLEHPKAELVRAGMTGYSLDLSLAQLAALMQVPQLSRGPRCQQQQMTSEIAFQVQ